MIVVRLLGGIKKSIGSTDMTINNTLSTLGDVIDLLEEKYDLKNKINETEVMVAINGVECSVLGGRRAKISNGDIITILSIVHGG